MELSNRGRVPSVECLFIEKELRPFQQLEAFAKERSSSGIKVRAENWDFAEHIDEIVRYCSTRRTFPLSSSSTRGDGSFRESYVFSAFEVRSAVKIVINLMSSFITRFVNDTATDLSDLLGEDFPELRSLPGTDLNSRWYGNTATWSSVKEGSPTFAPCQS